MTITYPTIKQIEHMERFAKDHNTDTQRGNDGGDGDYLLVAIPFRNEAGQAGTDWQTVHSMPELRIALGY